MARRVGLTAATPTVRASRVGRAVRTDHWMGTARMVLRIRAARRTGDAGAALRSLARGADAAVGARFRGQPVLLLLDPVLVGQLLVEHAADTTKGPGTRRTRLLLGDGLLTSEGADHRRARRLVAPAFSPRRLAGYTETFGSRAAAHAATWRDGSTVDMHAEMGRLTLDIVGRTLLGVELADDALGIRSGLESALAAFARVGFVLGDRRTVGRPGRAAREAAADAARAAASNPVHEAVEQILDARRAQPTQDRGDVVSALLAATREPGGLTTSEVHDHVMTLLMAGHETTANALAWTLLLLGRHPDVQDRLQAEVDVLGARLPASADLPRLAYTRAVLTEGMRLYPPAWLIGRTLSTAVNFGGWHAPAGATVAVSPLLLHHDARWFDDPERFDPERWLDARRDAVPRHAYLPFGAGPRACIGEQFAWAEATAVLAVIAARWIVRTEPGHTVVPQYRVTMRPGNGVPMRLTARTG